MQNFSACFLYKKNLSVNQEIYTLILLNKLKIIYINKKTSIITKNITGKIKTQKKIKRFDLLFIVFNDFIY